MPPTTSRAALLWAAAAALALATGAAAAAVAAPTKATHAPPEKASLVSDLEDAATAKLTKIVDLLGGGGGGGGGDGGGDGGGGGGGGGGGCPVGGGKSCSGRPIVIVIPLQWNEIDVRLTFDFYVRVRGVMERAIARVDYGSGVGLVYAVRELFERERGEERVGMEWRVPHLSPTLFSSHILLIAPPHTTTLFPPKHTGHRLPAPGLQLMFGWRPTRRRRMQVRTRRVPPAQHLPDHGRSADH